MCLTKSQRQPPGTLTVTDGRLIADTATERIELLSVQAPGKKRMPTADFLRGCRLEQMRLE